MRFLPLALISVLAGCSGTDPIEMSCKAQFLYAENGPDSAVQAFDEFSNKRDYVVANNLANYLMLRGFQSRNKSDFDRASRILESMDTSEVDHPLTASYVGLLKFMASENGSAPGSFRLTCSPNVSDVDCATAIASQVINQSALTRGRGSKVHSDFQALYSQTHLKVFGSEFQLHVDDWTEQFAQEESSCSSNGEEEPGTEHMDVPRVSE